MRAPLVVAYLALGSALEASVRPATYASAFDEAESAAMSSRLLSLEAEDIDGLGAESQFDTSRAWWGKETPAFGAQSRTVGGAGSELKRMGHLMRRQLQPQFFGLSYAFGVGGAVDHADAHSDAAADALADAARWHGASRARHDAGAVVLGHAGPDGIAGPHGIAGADGNDGAIGIAGADGLAGAYVDARAVGGHRGADDQRRAGDDGAHVFISVSGIDDEDFADDGITVVQYSLNDVISFVDSPDDVTDASVTIDDSRRRLQDGNVTATITYSVLLDTAASNGFSSTDEALETMEDEVADSAATGELAERINYWADYFGSDFSPDVDEEQEDNEDGFWNFAPTAAPTPETPFPTPEEPSTASPTSTPAPSTTPVVPTPAPQAVVVTPTLSPTTTPAPTPAARPSSKKSKNNNDAAELAIIIVFVIVGFLILVFLGYMYMRNRERKLTERKDSWDISTMFTDEANLPDAEEMIDVEPEAGGAGGADEADVAVVDGAGAQGDLVPLDEDQPQALQKITQAAEL
eukprot:CAMPEP_0197417822 /NCGR_PEP_ID=MMETSP1170-20131217/3751_1 /TAXON_ID=54406 /ORGANISM="Sarcinochrysis sp, Strain CCMP770" /LENGTH=521 /DNA_ID=CAMNT_0042944821 /DNA_START=62 /DNA_END=1627 /DNA_ORIENTATION=+